VGWDRSDPVALNALLEEVNDHLAWVLTTQFNTHHLIEPEMAMGGGHVVIRFYMGSDRWVFRAPLHSHLQVRSQLLAHRYAGHLGIIPEKIYHDSKCILERHVPGWPLGPNVRDELIVTLARALSELHKIPASGFGPLEYDTMAAFTDARHYYAQRPQTHVDRSETDLSSQQDDLLQRAMYVSNTLPPDLDKQPTFLGHGDLWRKNILAGPQSVHVIDWDRIGSYPREYDLVFMSDAQWDRRQCSLFLEHYVHPVAPDILQWFVINRTLRNPGLRLSQKIERITALDLH
jgi:hypothetical protein